VEDLPRSTPLSSEPLPTSAQLRTHLEHAYGLQVDSVLPLELGADAQAATYRADGGGQRWFLKLHRQAAAGPGVLVPHLLGATRGLRQVPAPLGSVTPTCTRATC